jgi:hypothetical protein
MAHNRSLIEGKGDDDGAGKTIVERTGPEMLRRLRGHMMG